MIKGDDIMCVLLLAATGKVFVCVNSFDVLVIEVHHLKV